MGVCAVLFDVFLPPNGRWLLNHPVIFVSEEQQKCSWVSLSQGMFMHAVVSEKTHKTNEIKIKKEIPQNIFLSYY